VQHEVDHINGYLYVQRMKNMREFGFERELAKDNRLG
jgi:peptide deformylase